jgi:hypothetical protein
MIRMLVVTQQPFRQNRHPPQVLQNLLPMDRLGGPLEAVKVPKQKQN